MLLCDDDAIERMPCNTLSSRRRGEAISSKGRVYVCSDAESPNSFGMQSYNASEVRVGMFDRLYVEFQKKEASDILPAPAHPPISCQSGRLSRTRFSAPKIKSHEDENGKGEEERYQTHIRTYSPSPLLLSRLVPRHKPTIRPRIPQICRPNHQTL